LETAARRELEEETSLRPRSLNQLAAFGNPGRDPRGWTVSVVFWAWVDQSLPAARAGDDAAQAAWWPLTALPSLAFDHAEILQTVRERINDPKGFENP
jgi:8-oxo-dGTP diphosphatase